MQINQDEPQEGGSPLTSRECAKHFLRAYIKDGWTLKMLNAKPLRIDRQEYAAFSGPGEVEDRQGQRRSIKRGELAITRVGERPECAVYEIETIKAEIHDEARGYKQQTLADVFNQEEREERPAPAPQANKKRPAVYRSYNAGYCQNPDCGEYLGYIETEGGRDRLYCNDKCRVSAYRKRKKEAERQQILQYNVELREYWQKNGVHGEVLLRLQEILFQHGKQAARAATTAVLVALAAQEEAGNRERFRLMDEIMLGGEEIHFPEVRLDDFRIPAGVQGWSEFVGNTTSAFLRQMRGYLYDRKREEYQRAQARKRLEELSKPPEDQPAEPPQS